MPSKPVCFLFIPFLPVPAPYFIYPDHRFLRVTENPRCLQGRVLLCILPGTHSWTLLTLMQLSRACPLGIFQHSLPISFSSSVESGQTLSKEEASKSVLGTAALWPCPVLSTGRSIAQGEIPAPAVRQTRHRHAITTTCSVLQWRDTHTLWLQGWSISAV